MAGTVNQELGLLFQGPNQAKYWNSTATTTSKLHS